MPKYEYSCPPCDESVEVERRITEEETVPACPSCAVPMRRIWNAAATHFKGGGWGGKRPDFKPKGNGID